MAQQTIDNGDSGLEARTKINDNFTEVYNPETLTVGSTGTPPITPSNVLSKRQTSSASGAVVNGIFYSEQTVATSGSIQGVEGYVKTSHNSGNVVLMIGTIGNVEVSGNNDVDYSRSVQAGGVVSGGGDIHEHVAFYAQPIAKTGGGVIDNCYGLYVDDPGNTGGEKWGVYVADANANNFFAGVVSIGSTLTTDSAILDLQSTTHAFCPPRMTKTQRNAISVPSAGMVIYQTDNTPGLRTYNGTNWMRYTETAD